MNGRTEEIDSRHEDEFLSEIQLRTLLEYVKGKAAEAKRKGAKRAVVNELIIFLLTDTGLRASELCNLNIRDSPTSHGENGIWVWDAAGNARRTVEPGPETAQQLDRYIRLYRREATPDEPLFVNERDGRLSYMSLYSKLRIIGQKAGIGTLHPQMLRHTNLMRLYDTTQDLRFVQLHAGHARAATTARYARICKRHGSRGLPTGNRMGSNDGVAPHAERAGGNAITPIHSADSQGIESCGACGRSVARNAATRIDSGQILCRECLGELRSKEEPP